MWPRDLLPSPSCREAQRRTCGCRNCSSDARIGVGSRISATASCASGRSLVWTATGVCGPAWPAPRRGSADCRASVRPQTAPRARRRGIHRSRARARTAERRSSRAGRVEVRLLGQEGVAIVLACRGVAGPGRAAETGDPIVRRAAVRGRITPDVPELRWTPPRTRNVPIHQRAAPHQSLANERFGAGRRMRARSFAADGTSEGPNPGVTPPQAVQVLRTPAGATAAASCN